MCNEIPRIGKRIYRVFLGLVGFKNDKKFRNLFRLFQIAFYTTLFVFLVDIISIFIGSQNFGAFGDFFGGVLNPILTFLTFMGLLITIVLQQKELILTRKELHNSANALEQQAYVQEKQRFEDTFFSLLEQHNILLDKIIGSRSGSSDANEVNQDARSARQQLIGYRLNSCENENLQELKYKLLNNWPILNQYFRVLYQILKFIASSCHSSTVKNNFSYASLKDTKCSQDEKMYANIIRSFLSEDIHYLLAINCFCKNENDHFIEYKILVERYSFFEHMPIKLPDSVGLELIKKIIDEIIKHYDRNAFGRNIGMDE